MMEEPKARLREIDPATLEAGTALDGLIWGYIVPEEARKYQFPPPEICTDDGLAFKLLWPWLLRQNLSSLLDGGDFEDEHVGLLLGLDGETAQCCVLCMKTYWDEGFPREGTGRQFNFRLAEADTWALALCRAVVAVAREAAEHDD